MNSCGDGPRGEPPFTSSYLWKLKRSQSLFSRAPWVKRWFSLDPVSHKLLYWKTADCEARGQPGSTFRRRMCGLWTALQRFPLPPRTHNAWWFSLHTVTTRVIVGSRLPKPLSLPFSLLSNCPERLPVSLAPPRSPPPQSTLAPRQSRRCGRCDLRPRTG